MGVNRKIELPWNTMKSDLEENLKIFYHKETHHWIFMTVWHFPTNRNQPFDILRLKVWHFPSQGNYSFEFLWPSDIFHHKETHHWIFCDRLTFSITWQRSIGYFVTVWHFPTGRNSPLDYLWPSDIFQQRETSRLKYSTTKKPLVSNFPDEINGQNFVRHFPQLRIKISNIFRLK